ncbi:MAG: hypothetical protein HOH95_06310 [Dehalococcoidia bacterium]|jgi:hypothetical protein|nr:hypothetical protein [Dehalococcoidia bacterium]
MNNHHSDTTTARRTRNLRHVALTAMLALPLLFAAACGGSSSEPVPAATPNASTVATQALIADVAEAATDLSTALENPDVSSDAWRANAVAALATLSTQVAATSEQLDTTDGATAEQKQLAEATTQYSQAAGVLALGLETLDLDKIDASATLLAQATASLVAAQVMLIQ